MIKISYKGDFAKTYRFMRDASNHKYAALFSRYGEKGVEALAAATPKDSGVTAASWVYKVEDNGKEIVISWHNTNVKKGIVIAVILQYGHGTGTGGYVQGIDYINPAMKPIFEEIANDAWKEVVSK